MTMQKREAGRASFYAACSEPTRPTDSHGYLSRRAHPTTRPSPRWTPKPAPSPGQTVSTPPRNCGAS